METMQQMRVDATQRELSAFPDGELVAAALELEDAIGLRQESLAVVGSILAALRREAKAADDGVAYPPGSFGSIRQKLEDDCRSSVHSHELAIQAYLVQLMDVLTEIQRRLGSSPDFMDRVRDVDGYTDHRLVGWIGSIAGWPGQPPGPPRVPSAFVLMDDFNRNAEAQELELSDSRYGRARVHCLRCGTSHVIWMDDVADGKIICSCRRTTPVLDRDSVDDRA